LNFSYTVLAGQTTADLAVAGFNANGASIRDAAGNNADPSGAIINPNGTLTIDTTAPTVLSIATSGTGISVSGNGDLNAGKVVTSLCSLQ